MKTNIEFRKGILFIRLNGALIRRNINKFESEILPVILKQGLKYVVINLENLEYLDKYGIESLSNLYEIMSLTTEGGIVATPNEMQKDTKMAWQTSGQINSIYSSSYTSRSNSLTGEAIYDGFWIPSYYEVCNTSTSSAYTNSTSAYTGLWGLNSTMRGFNGTCYSSGSSASYCWLRSGSL